MVWAGQVSRTQCMAVLQWAQFGSRVLSTPPHCRCQLGSTQNVSGYSGTSLGFRPSLEPICSARTSPPCPGAAVNGQWEALRGRGTLSCMWVL